MKKHFTPLFIFFMMISFSLFAQRNLPLEPSKKFKTKNEYPIQLKTTPKTLMPAAFTKGCCEIPDGLEFYKDKNNQWFTGPNSYGDRALGQIFKEDSPNQLIGVQAIMVNNRKGDEETIYAKIYSLGTDGLPSELLGTSLPVSSEDITTDKVQTINFLFETAVNVPESFVVAIDVPEYTASRSDILIATSPNGCYGEPDYALCYTSVDGKMAWTTIMSAWKMSAKDMLELAIFAVIDEDYAGISDAIANNKPHIYPNPVKDILTIQNALGSTVKIFDITGKMIMERKITEVKQSIQTSHLQKGIYMIKTEGKTKNSVTKFIKE